MRWGLFVLGLLGLLVFGALAGFLVTGVVSAVGKLDEGGGGLFGIVFMSVLAGVFFFMAMASTAGMIVAWDSRRSRQL